ncbi:MAG: rod shape-determining protein MreC [Eubacteriales bacterium]
MRNSRRIIPWIIFSLVFIVGLVVYIKTYGAKRYPEQLTEEQAYNMLLDEKDTSKYLADGTTTIEDLANNAAAAAAKGTYYAADGVKGFFQRLFNPKAMDEELLSLQQQVQRLETELEFAEATKEENQRLQALLGFTEEFPQYEYVHAKIIISDPNSWFLEFTIDKGANHGIVVNSAVVNEDGLVGRIIEVYPNTSKVLAIVDPQSAVPVIATRSRDNGIAGGAIDPYTNTPEIKMSYLLNDADLVPGDTVVSSSLMGIFPKGITVGEVKSVVREDSSEQYAIVTPSVDFAHLENLLIIVGRSNQEIIDEAVIDETTEETEGEQTAEGDQATEEPNAGGTDG